MSQFSRLMMLLTSYVWNFPMLWEWGTAFSRPIALVAEDRRILEKCVERVCPYPMRIFKTDGIQKLRNKIASLTHKNVTAIFMDWEKSSDSTEKEMSKFEYLEHLAASQKIDQHPLNLPVFILCTGFVPDVLIDRVVVVSIPSAVDVDIRDMTELIPDFEDFQGIHDRFSEYCDHSLTERVFAAAALMLAPSLEKHGEEKMVENLLQAATMHACEAEQYEPSEEIAKKFSEMLLCLAENGYFDDVVPLPDLSMEVCECMEDYVFIDHDRLYLSTKKFKKLVAELGVPVTYLKCVLKDREIIKCTPGGYTTKMSYTTYAGTVERRRMVCINIDQIKSESIDGEINLAYFVD